jgi:hypothetical protein
MKNPKEEPKQELNLNCFDCNKSLQDCTCIEDTIDMTQETLEEAAERLSELQEGTYTPQHKITYKHGFEDGAKWQQERSYSEEDMIEASKYGYNFHKTTQFPNQEFEDSCIRNTQQWFEQFKKK